MARIILPLVVLAALAPYVSAGVEFTKPKAGAKLTAGTAIEVEWKEGGDGAKLTNLLTYELFLVAGGNDAAGQIQFPITTKGSFGVGSTATGMIGVAVGESKPDNAYFLKMIAVGKTGGQLITYSDRFSYSGMTGTFPAPVKAALKDISGTAGPKAVDTVVDPAKGAKPGAADPAAGDFDVEYTMQTGLTRYAPMQPVPPTKVTAKNVKPLFPTSSVSIATTFLPIPSIVITVTQSQTYSVSSMANTVAAAPHPTDDMQKFLNRWKD
ncbi:beta-1,6-glucan boisynthesis protein-like protein [Cucurbitaria berberidis CBS 394.84]|uniref:Beta-1,6-glucan boisynthesis protein-like protein n=1 Tax=Cucurbitaria berberidis CBS 394.84 TaxID=1168544 RepID=A0A9P4L5X5_9PLEO|nr:beta-1,6-glucan boisynthesis protein-like protein [Cucurbitaria berberidis CBS 394.84]KAF1843396.1 beta-1,6-glucan boisynthesis protein-like protein [Cucurbitaria berberidis CBS 394.84]